MASKCPALSFDKSSVTSDEALHNMEKNIPPASVEEYMIRVRLEADSLPNVSVDATIDTSKYRGNQTPNMATLPKAELMLQCSEKWKSKSLNQFCKLRKAMMASRKKQQNVYSVTPKMNQVEWDAFLFGKKSLKGYPPMVHFLVQLECLELKKLLAYQADFLAANDISVSRAAWVYAILALIGLSLDGGTSANLRQILRSCCNLYSKVKDTEENDIILRSLELLLVIILEYFGQSDCIEDVTLPAGSE